ncbi:O-methylsterigmatocystin oxidoreductase [Cubamyces menziesii]|nr:O-methylsterigmatocystin oxidoreductase [Cubamyces menziesii]
MSNVENVPSSTLWGGSLAAVIALVFGLAIVRALSRDRLSLPPGPPGLPLLGNVFDIPKQYAWITYRDWAAKYGDVVAARVFGHTLIVIHSLEAANELLDKRSSIYSDRPMLILAKLIGWTDLMVFKQYGDEWREERRLLSRYFQPNTVPQYRAVQQREARRFLNVLLRDQNDLDGSLKLLLCKTSITTVYGIPSEEVGEHFAHILSEAGVGLSEAFEHGAFIVELLPWLRHVPNWVPGTAWKKRLVRWKAQYSALVETPFQLAQEAMARGVAEPSILSDLLDTEELDGEIASKKDRVIKSILATAFLGATETTSGTLHAFFCAMLLHPEVQQRAQAELDDVVGLNRLPDHTDRPLLPYISAMVIELLRWYPPAPLVLPYRCMKEDIYRGWRIPEGAIIRINIWAMYHNAEHFPEPDIFRPERYLKNGELDDELCDRVSSAFGMGRRICPGRYFADDTLFINIASILHVFRILPPLDVSGRPIFPEVKLTSGLISHVEKFEYRIRPRSSSAEELIRHERGVYEAL